MSAVYYTITCILMFIDGTISLNSQSYHTGYAYRHRLSFTQYTPEQIRAKTTRLMRELVCDADAKVMSIQFIRRDFQQSGKYHLGELIFNTRNKHGYIVRKLMLSQDNAGQWEDPKFVLATLRIQSMFQEVDNLVQMAIEYDQTDPSGRIYGRMGPIVDKDENMDEGSLLRTKNLKQKAYMERRKKEWAIAKGYDITNKSTLLMLKNKNKEEGGFESDFNA